MVKAKIQSVENKKKVLKSVQKGVSEERPAVSKAKLKSKTPWIILSESGNISELSDDESSEDDNNVDFEFSGIANGIYVVVHYAGKRNVYDAAIVTSVNNDEMFNVSLFKCNGKKYFIFDENDHNKVGADFVYKKLTPPEIKQELDQVYYYFNCVDFKSYSKLFSHHRFLKTKIVFMFFSGTISTVYLLYIFNIGC